MRWLAIGIVVAVIVGIAAIVWPHRALSDHRSTPSDAATADHPIAPPAAPPLPAIVADALAGNGIVVAWTTHAGARLEPCGCVAGMHGGLARRATLIDRAPADRVLVLDGGGWSGGRADYQLVKGEFYLRALAASGCDAVGMGSAEVALGRVALGRLAAAAVTARVPLVCANLRASDGSAIVPASVRLRAAGIDVVVTSVVPAQAAGDGLIVSEPSEALLRVRAAAGDARVVVLADLDRDSLDQLARAVPGLALVVGGAVDQPSSTARVVGACRIVHVANDGKTLGWWPWGADACAFELISEGTGDHPAVRTLIGSYQEAIGAMDLSIDGDERGLTALAGTATGARFVGNAVCMDCHREAHRIYGESRHAQALAALQTKHYDRDPECLRCHVTGLGLPDGYRRRAPSATVAPVAMVACEACHGRASQHVTERTAAQLSSGSLTPVTPATCMRCHDRDNSPRFDYAVYWEKIRHDSR